MTMMSGREGEAACCCCSALAGRCPPRTHCSRITVGLALQSSAAPRSSSSVQECAAPARTVVGFLISASTQSTQQAYVVMMAPACLGAGRDVCSRTLPPKPLVRPALRALRRTWDGPYL